MAFIPLHWFPSPFFGWMLAFCFCGWAFLEFVNHLIGKGIRLGQTGQSRDRGSYWLLIVMVYACFCLAYAGRAFNWGVVVGASQYLGLGLMVAGIALREWAVVVLGRYFSVVVALEVDHQLVTAGPYRWLRHPAYTGGAIATLGFALALGSWVSAALITLILLLAFAYRIRLEEQLLLAAFGDVYRDYMARTWKLFPGW
ncbi:MAG: isoprenylcysteine carboxylmethyltransferase family protein [Anaerolineae bacterium]|nr:isoprenylcysteine carboxylmethyltransferase family protein [Anaerolineae bacterium]